MIGRLAARFAASLGVVFGALTLIFLILNWLPGDPAALIAGDAASPETIEQIRAQLHLDRSLWDQYRDYLVGVAHGDLGRSYITREPVTARLIAHFPATFKLTLSAGVIALVVGVGLGVLSARREGGFIDQLIQHAALGFVSLPPFWLGLLAILFFSVYLGWLPVLGDGGLRADILPSTCLGLVVSVHFMRLVRSSAIDQLHEPYVTALRAKGLGQLRVFYVHVLRNALLAAVTLLGVVIGELLSGAVVIETLFARQGIGRLAVEAIGQKDLPVVQGAILLASVSYVAVNLLVDVSYAWIDPRLRVLPGAGAR